MTDDPVKNDASSFIASATLDPLSLLNMRNNHAGLAWSGNLLAESTGGVLYQEALDKKREMHLLREYFREKHLLEAQASTPSSFQTTIRNGISYAYKYIKDMDAPGQPGLNLSNSFTNALSARSAPGSKNGMEPDIRFRAPAPVVS